MRALPVLALAAAVATPITVEASLPTTGRQATSTRNVGYEVISVPNGADPKLKGAVWYPTHERAQSETLESFTQQVAISGPVAGTRLPLIIISHGGGGSFAGHYDTAVAPARAGYVVAAISHVGDSADDQSRVLEQWRRPEQLSRLLDYMLDSWRGRISIDSRRIGAFGFSNGGFTVLVAAGGNPDLKTIDPYCRAHSSHDLCTALAAAGVATVVPLLPPSLSWKHDMRIRAVAAAAPAFGFTFDRAGLVNLDIPVLLWSGAKDRHQPSPYYEDSIRTMLPRPPEYRIESNAGHYAFLPPCSEALGKTIPALCADLPGFDRAAFHRRMNASLVSFFNRSLPPDARSTSRR